MARRFPTACLRWLAYLWASPYTLTGLVAGWLLGGRIQRIEGVLEIDGRRIAWVLRHLPVRAAAITLGHCVWGRDAAALARTRIHERVHVRQFERWGLLMGPAYVACSVVLWLGGRDYYRGNPFEIEAFQKEAAARQSAAARQRSISGDAVCEREGAGRKQD